MDGMATTVEQVITQIDEVGLVKLASDMVRIPSQIPNEGALAEFTARAMRTLGCFDEVFTQPVVPGRPNVVGILRGSGDGPTFLLNGHLDTGAPTDGWEHDPYEPVLKDGYLTGFGITDMKGAVACMIKAAEAVARSGLRRRGHLVITAVVHHDVCGLGTKFFLASNDMPLHMGICGEPTGLQVQLAHGGAWQFELITYGRGEHISRRERGLNATSQMLRLLAALDERKLTHDPNHGLEGLPRLLVGYMQGGTTTNRTAEQCIARGDVRIVPGMTADSLRRDFQDVIQRLAAADADFKAEVRMLTYQRPYQIDPQAPVVRLVADAHRAVTGQAPLFSKALPVSSYVTDAADLVRAGIPTVVYGPGNWTLEPNERISVAELVTATKVFALAAARVITQEL